MLKLIDLLRLSGITLTDWNRTTTPPDCRIRRWKSWQEQQSQKNSECDQLLSLVQNAFAVPA